MRRLRVSICSLAAILPLLGALVQKASGNDGSAETTTFVDESPITESDRDHWSFRSVVRWPVPEVASPSWTQSTVDRFILRKLEDRNLNPLPAAERRVLMRRYSWLLTGLPPTPDELQSFELSSAPDSIDRFVDRLLASPRYSEHWAQHWLDVARFAETDGFEHDHVRNESWRFRDWVISAFDRDMPFDQFVTSQIAGDLLSEGQSSAVATAFCVSGPDMPDMNLQDERRHLVLNEMTGTVGAVFLGLQIGCAQCHDHKYDALSQADFYRLRAYFESSLNVEKNSSLTVLAERKSVEPLSRVYIRGDWRRPGAIVPASTPRVVRTAGSKLDRAEPARLQLAREIAGAENPLTARVLVNRIWMQHFGEGLCRTPNDFGVMGDVPEHPELLDWLASEFASEQGLAWSIKRLHRSICLGSTFQTASGLATCVNDEACRSVECRPVEFQARIAALQSLDPTNRLLGRFPRRRLNGEAIRDAILFVGDNLNFRRGGQGVFAPLPLELRESLLKNQWPQTQDVSAHDRRSVFMFARRNLRYPIFDVFDRPDANASCAQRNRSVTALQALTLLNSEFSWAQADRLADRISMEEPNDQVRFVDAAFVRTLGRIPTQSERATCLRMLRETGEPDRALADLCLALFNLHEFVYIE